MSAVAKSHKVPVLLHNVIYKLISDIRVKLTERLLPLDVEEQIGELLFKESDLFSLNVVDCRMLQVYAIMFDVYSAHYSFAGCDLSSECDLSE